MTNPQPTACPICKSSDVFLDGDYRNPKNIAPNTFSHLKIFVCRACGYGFSYPKADMAALGEYYSKDYTPRNFERVKTEWPVPDYRSTAQIHLGQLFCNFSKGDVFLDIGPGAGGSLHTASVLLEQPTIAAVELNETTIAIFREKIRGIEIYGTTEEFKAKSKKKAKIVLMSHALEHFESEDVIPTLGSIRECLLPDGCAVIEVPNWDFREFNKRISDVPHLGFFSQESLSIAAEAAGFNVAYSALFGYPHKMGLSEFRDMRTRNFSLHGMKDPMAAKTLMALYRPEFLRRDQGKWLRVVLTPRAAG